MVPKRWSQDGPKKDPFLNAFEVITKISRKSIVEHGRCVFNNAANTRTVEVDHVVGGDFSAFKLSQST